jgi:alkylation response protein AidB-like acyl-CoA dehydrogenase
MFYDELLSPEERKLRHEVREFVRDEVPPELLVQMDRDEIKWPQEYVRKLGERNLLGLRFDPQSGGRGLSWTGEMVAGEEIAVLNSVCACAFMMPSMVGQAIHVFGSDEQKERWLRPMLAGRLQAAECLTEPRGGSDFFGATTRAEPDGDHFVVRGQKRFVVAAEVADIFLVYCRTNFEDVDPRKSISAFIIERGPGIETEYLYGLMGNRGGGAARISFRDLRVPRENLVGGLHGGFDVFNQMMFPERMACAAGALGGARASLDIATRYSHKRRAFGKPIRKFQAVNFMVADAITQLDAARGLTYLAAKAIDNQSPSARRLVSEAKKFATEAAWDVVNKAMQVMGGIGYTDVFPIERYLRDIRLMMIYTGSNEVMNMMIQHEFYDEVLGGRAGERDTERDARACADVEEKCFSDEDMWRGHEQSEAPVG